MEFSTHGFTTSEIEFMIQILNHPRAWKVPFYYNHKTTKIQVYKMPGKQIDLLFKSNDLVGLSVCDRTDSKNIKIYLRKENWDSIPKVSGYSSLQQYRIYLILHEFGHALGYDHEKCTHNGDPAPVMLQQTKGTGKCYPDPWVLKI